MNQIAQITEEIQNFFYPTFIPEDTVITYKNGLQEHGYFHNFDDSDKLFEEGKCRYIRMNDSVAFQKNYQDSKKLDPAFSIVIDLKAVSNISLINQQTGVILKQVNLM